MRYNSWRNGTSRGAVLFAVCLAMPRSWRRAVGRAAAVRQQWSGGSSKKVDIAAALKKPTNITVWAWTPGTDQAVAMFEKAYPNINVTLQNVGQGPPHYRKVRTAIKSGQGHAGCRADGVPVHPELPAHQGSAGHEAVSADELPHATIRSGSRGRSTSTTGPTACRGTAVRWRSSIARTCWPRPAIKTPIVTWDDFATGRGEVPPGQPEVVSDQLPGAQTGQWMALFWQTGARPFTSDPTNMKVDLTDPEDQAGHRVLGQAVRQRVHLP